MSTFHTGKGTDKAEFVGTIHWALGLDVTLIDAAEAYGHFTNEELVGRTIRDRRDRG